MTTTTRRPDGARRVPLPVANEVHRAREVVALLHAELPRWGLVVWSAGNVSQRVRIPGGEDLLVIKPSGVTYRQQLCESMLYDPIPTDVGVSRFRRQSSSVTM